MSRTLRQARLVAYPDPVEALLAAQRAGAREIALYCARDRRHIQHNNRFRIHQPILEMVEIAMGLRPNEVCLLPDRRRWATDSELPGAFSEETRAKSGLRPRMAHLRNLATPETALSTPNSARRK
jgi:pyridoxine 5'-phosphate synthase PdxJ